MAQVRDRPLTRSASGRPWWRLTWFSPGLSSRVGRRGAVGAGLGEWPALFPPLALGVGAVVLSGLLWMGTEALSPALTLGRFLRILAILLDPDRTPGVLLILAVAAVRRPAGAGGGVGPGVAPPRAGRRGNQPRGAPQPGSERRKRPGLRRAAGPAGPELRTGRDEPRPGPDPRADRLEPAAAADGARPGRRAR